jgi:hypothetical protein
MATATGMKPIPQARKAEKRQVKLKLGIQGPSGSGKTEGALALATNLWPDARILLVDTENESASLYADRYNFDTIPLDPPFESMRYEACIDYSVQEKYDVLILDSVTHQWDGEGGILRRKEELDRRPNANSWANWSLFTPEHTHFIEAIKQAPIHIIATMRTKQDWCLQTNDKGKQKPVKLGMAPIQRDGFDYEFSLVFDVQMDHKAETSKNRTGLFEGKVVDLTDKKVAKQLREWLESGKPYEAPAPAPASAVATPAPAPVQRPPQAPPAAPPAAAKVEGWNLDGDHLHAHVYDTQKRVSKKGSDFIAVKHNGEVNGKSMLYCYNDKLFDAVLASKNHRAVFFVSPGEYTMIDDVLEIDGVHYANGKPAPAAPQPQPAESQMFQATDDDIPF